MGPRDWVVVGGFIFVATYWAGSALGSALRSLFTPLDKPANGSPGKPAYKAPGPQSSRRSTPTPHLGASGRSWIAAAIPPPDKRRRRSMRTRAARMRRGVIG